MVDILVLLDELEQEIETAKKVPLAGKILLEKDDLLDIIDKIRTELPEEIRQARWIVRERERVINEAKAEASKIIEDAKSKTKQLALESEVVKEAKLHGEEIIAEAHKISYEIKSSAHEYADNILASIENNLQKSLEIILQGRKELKTKNPQTEKDQEEVV